MTSSVPTYRLYREESGESGDFWIHGETIPERTRLHNWQIAPHRHEAFFQIFLLTAGGGKIVQPDATLPMRAPCAVFIPAGAVHGFSYETDVDGLVITALGERLRPLAAADRYIATFTAQTRIVPLAPDDPDAAYATDSINRLYAELHSMAASRLLMLEPLMTGAIVSLARASGSQTGEPGSSGERLRLETLTTLIATNFRSRKPAAFYAAALGISATHLNRFIRDATGLSLLELVATHIMEAARRDLVFTPTPVHSIGYSLGFSDPAYFSRFFRKHAGLSPAAFRDRERRRLSP